MRTSRQNLFFTRARKRRRHLEDDYFYSTSLLSPSVAPDACEKPTKKVLADLKQVKKNEQAAIARRKTCPAEDCARKEVAEEKRFGTGDPKAIRKTEAMRDLLGKTKLHSISQGALRSFTANKSLDKLDLTFPIFLQMSSTSRLSIEFRGPGSKDIVKL